jgi:hypothetical protein
MELSHEKATVYRCAIEVYKATVVSPDINKALRRALKKQAARLLQHAAMVARFSGSATGAHALRYSRDAATKLAAIADALRLEGQLTSRAHRRMRAALILFERASTNEVPREVRRGDARARGDVGSPRSAPAPLVIDFEYAPYPDSIEAMTVEADEEDDDGRPPDKH